MSRRRRRSLPGHRPRRSGLNNLRGSVAGVELLAGGQAVAEQLHRRDGRIELEWTAKADPDTPYGARQLSDGTLRFMALTTLLLQPVIYQQETMIIDEPELGLHPYALNVLADLLKRAAEERQLIVATQSVELISAMDPGQVVVVDQREGASTFARLDLDELQDWLKDYALGELWKMNILGGRPAR